ncbi:Gfo/Idh/MocA family oxidoreductase [Brevibacillus ruminantium]|uniref:Gfo/Idh/MocA family oxidoreductase n=1 Tax=Brevibacillus ruminantium TaxID=2950604 RepID=A0ABY4WB98_9BACL|nr:Gfo/Idh/MocA family oxidoreductase [Brevibacillus ruminantium]USG64323.1 Gfo/Idh/MocA family oxidoreductase [Brevibacillus ruminantium]
MKERYAVGIIGLGVMGERLLNAMVAHERFSVIAVCDISADRAKATAEHYDINAWYTNHQELLDKEELDLVYIAVPPKFHHGVALDTLAAGKHVLCEKPLAGSVKEGAEMLAAAEKAGVIHAMNFPIYYRPLFLELKRRIEEIGNIRRIDIVTHFHQWPRPWQQTAWLSGREQGGFVREVLPHFLHLTQALFGSYEVVRSDVDYPEDPEACEVGISALLRLLNGTPVTINGLGGIGQKEHLTYTIYGTEGTLTVQNWNTLLAGGKGELPVEVTMPEQDRLSLLLDEMANALDGKEARLVGFDTGLAVQKGLDTLLGIHS